MASWVDMMGTALKLGETMRAGKPFEIELGGDAALLDPAGVVFFTDDGMLCVADLHLEKGASFARRRQFIPPYDTYQTLDRLAVLVQKYQPKTIVCLGDSFHDDYVSASLSQDVIKQIAALSAQRDMVWITGNHDPSPPENVPGMMAETLAVGRRVMRHIAEPTETGFELSGHYHPCARISVRSKSIRKPCFAFDGRRMILPSFGAYTGGLNLKNRAFSGLFSPSALCAYMLGSVQIYPIGAKDLIADGQQSGNYRVMR